MPTSGLTFGQRTFTIPRVKSHLPARGCSFTMTDLGDPIRVIEVEPLELPVPTEPPEVETPDEEPIWEPSEEPVEVPV